MVIFISFLYFVFKDDLKSNAKLGIIIHAIAYSSGISFHAEIEGPEFSELILNGIIDSLA